MFQKKQLIYSEELGVCKVENIVSLSAAREEPSVDYYALKPMFGNKQAAYLPVEGHKQVLRELFTVEEAEALKNTEEAKKDGPLKEAIAYVLSAAQQQQ